METQFAHIFVDLLNVTNVTGEATAPAKAKFFPNITNPYLSQPSTTQESTSIAITFKSLKPPKFNISLNALTSTTVFQLKQKLGEEINVPPASIKLMLRAKTLADADTLENDTTLNVLITDFKPVVEQPAKITDQTWLKIAHLLQQDLHDAALVAKTIENFKKSV